MRAVRGVLIIEAQAYGAASDQTVLWAMMRGCNSAVRADVLGATPLDVALLVAQTTLIVDVLFVRGVRRGRRCCGGTRDRGLGFLDGAL